MKKSPRTRARDADRAAASEIVSAAFADGQLDRGEHDTRVARLQRAITFADLDAELGDLQRPGQSLWRAPRTASAAAGSSPDGKSKQKIAVLVGAGALILSAVYLPGLLLGDDPTSEPVPIGAPAGEPEPIANPLTPQGWDEFLTALDEKTGGTFAVEVYPRPDYVSVSVPVGKRGERVIDYVWNGEWDEGSPDTSDSSRKQLRDIDATTFASALARVSDQVEEPDEQWLSMYGNIDRYDSRACYAASASNRFGESETVYFRCDGTPIPD